MKGIVDDPQASNPWWTPTSAMSTQKPRLDTGEATGVLNDLIGCGLGEWIKSDRRGRSPHGEANRIAS
jgi:hypothetical protein